MERSGAGMNFRLLKIFATVCASRGVTDAARALRMTQPGVTHAVKELEKECGLVLFDRLSRRLRLTEAGKLYLEKAQNLLEMCEELENFAPGLERQAPLRIGCCITIACFWLPGIVKRFERGGGWKAEIRVASASAVMDMLAANEIDLALYEGPDPHDPYLSIPFSSYSLTPVCPPGHSFAGRRNVGLDELLRERLLLREPGSAIRDVFDSFLRLRQLTARPMMTSVNSQALLRAVTGGMGVSILADVMARIYVRRGVVASFAVKEMRLKNENRLVFHADKHRTEAMRRFMECAGRTGKDGKRNR